MVNLITDSFDIWTTAQSPKSNGNSNGNGAAYGIKKLRELILELAVRGKLVPQDPNDEPASVLMEKIDKEKSRLVKEGKIRKEKPLSEIGEDEKPFALSEGWEWTRLGIITEINPRNEASEDSPASFIPMSLITVSHLGIHGQRESTWGAIKQGYTHFADGDVGLAKITPCFENGKAALFSGLLNGIGAGTTELHVARPLGETLSARYTLLYLKSPQFLLVGETKMTGTAGQKRVPKDFFANNPFPLPPLAEQHRIVAKVDELMKLCDQLEQQQTNNSTTHQTLVEALLATLTTAANPAEFAGAWQRMAEHFDTLFTTEQSIDQLKQTIRQLAVMGKLVRQDPNDEPASVLLEKIAKEKARLVKEGKIRKQPLLVEITQDEEVFELPSGWVWNRIGAASLYTEYGLSERTFEGVDGVPMITMGDIQSGNVVLGGQKHVSSSVEGLPKLYLRNGDLLYNRTNSAELVGKTGIFLGPDERYTFASYLVRIRCVVDSVHPLFLNLAMNTPLFRATQIEPYLKQQCGQANVNATTMQNMIVPIPPLAEQHRIVAKVDELLAVCDTLKARLKDAQTTQVRLADAIVEQATSS